MTTGTDTYKGLAVPLNGDSQITQRTAATDILTITGASGQGGDFLVCEIAAGTEKFVVDVSGNVTIAGTNTTTGATTLTGGIANEVEFSLGAKIPLDYYLRFSGPVATAPITGLTQGDMFVSMGSSTPQIGICYSTAANSLRYITADTKTFGRTTA